MARVKGWGNGKGKNQGSSPWLGFKGAMRYDKFSKSGK